MDEGLASLNFGSFAQHRWRFCLFLLAFLALLLLVFLHLQQIYTPYKDEDNYIANAAAWWSGEALPYPAFSPLHMLALGGLPLPIVWNLAPALSLVLIAVATCLAAKVYTHAAKERPRTIFWASLAFFFFPPVIFAAIGMLAEPFALATLLAALVALLSDKSRRFLALWVFVFALLTAASRLDYAFYAIGLACALAIFGERRWLRLLAMIGGAVAGLFAVAAVDAAFGADFSLMRSHGAFDQTSAPAELLSRAARGLFDFAFVGWSYWFAPPLRWAGLAGVLLYTRKVGVRQARPLLAMLLASGMVFLMTDVSRVVRSDGYYWRYLLPFMVPAAFGIFYSLSLVTIWLRRFCRRDLVLAQLVLIFAPAYFLVTRAEGLFPQEYRALEVACAEKKIGGEVLAQRYFAHLYLGASVTDIYDGRLHELPPAKLAELARDESIDWILLSNRWEQVSDVEMDAYFADDSPLIAGYAVVWDNKIVATNPKHGEKRLILLRRRGLAKSH